MCTMFLAKIVEIIPYKYDPFAVLELVNGQKLYFFDPDIKINHDMIGQVVEIRASIGAHPKKIDSREHQISKVDIGKSMAQAFVKGELLKIAIRDHKDPYFGKRLYGIIDCGPAKLLFDCGGTDAEKLNWTKLKKGDFVSAEGRLDIVDAKKNRPSKMAEQ